MPQQEEVFSEQEATTIIRRAVELQEESAAGSYVPGISREELARIAAEVGVEPRFLEEAILAGGEVESKKGPLHLTEEFERVIPGELDPQDFDKVATEIRPFSNIGQVGVAQIGRSLSASAWTGISQAKVEVTSRGGRTRLKVKSMPFLAIFGGFYPAMMGAIISAAAMGEAGHVAAGLGVAAGLLVAGFVAFRGLLHAGHRASKRLAERLKNVIAKETATQDASPQADAGSLVADRLAQSTDR